METNIDSIKIDEKSVKIFSTKLHNYVKNEKPFDKKFKNKTHILDMLYFMGTAIDEERFLGASGFESFQEILKEAMA